MTVQTIQYVDKKLFESFGTVMDRCGSRRKFLELKDRRQIDRLCSDWKTCTFSNVFGHIDGPMKDKVCLFGGDYDHYWGKQLINARHPDDNKNINILSFGKEKINGVEHNEMLYEGDRADEYIKGCEDITRINFQRLPNNYLD